MDVSAYLDLRIAPRAIFDSLAQRRSRVRYMVPKTGGDWEAVTWGAHAEQIRRLGQFLMGTGVKSGERVAVFAHNRVEWMSAALAAQAIGGVMVPVYPTSTADQAGYVIEHSDARVVFADSAEVLSAIFAQWRSYEHVLAIVLLDPAVDPHDVLARLKKQGVAVPGVMEVTSRLVPFAEALRIGAMLERENPSVFDHAMAAVSLDQFGVMLYTSGTTGRPKGVPLTHRNVGVNGRDWLQNNASLIDEGAVDVLWLPMSHIFGFGEACLGNTLGFATYLADPVSVLAKLPEVRPSVFMSVPRYFEKLAEVAMAESDERRQREKLQEVTGGQLRFCLSGGAGLKREVKEFFHRCGVLIIEGYGLTEASPTLTLNRPDAFRFDTVGKPLPSVDLQLAEDGEILARGESIFKGYHKDPVASRDIFTSDGWLKTGDLGRFTDDGFLQIIGRKKEILVTAAGKNISPVNIEERFVNDPYIQHVVVYGDGEKYLVAGVWIHEEHVAGALGADDSETGRQALIARRIEKVNADLARYETIKTFAIISEPLTVEGDLLTPTLKIKRKKVYERFDAIFQGLYASQSPAVPQG